MRLFLDTEFNEFQGDLISMALVAEDGSEWYEVFAIPEKPGSFVAEHVLPKLGKEPIEPIGLQFYASLAEFISHYDGCEVIADWPADFEHFAACLAAIGSDLKWTLPIECTMRLVRGDETITPDNPHNALSDARALRDWWMRKATNTQSQIEEARSADTGTAEQSRSA